MLFFSTYKQKYWQKIKKSIIIIDKVWVILLLDLNINIVLINCHNFIIWLIIPFQKWRNPVLLANQWLIFWIAFIFCTIFILCTYCLSHLYSMRYIFIKTSVVSLFFTLFFHLSQLNDLIISFFKSLMIS